MKVANIPIAVVVDGQRRVIPVGAEIPADIAGHDVRVLTASGAITDTDAAARDIAALAADKKRAAAEFDAARAAVRQAADSVAGAGLAPAHDVSSQTAPGPDAGTGGDPNANPAHDPDAPPAGAGLVPAHDVSAHDAPNQPKAAAPRRGARK